jgi:hypothetical protein
MKYRVYCESEGKFIEVESLLVREVCPNDSEHVVTSGSLTEVDDSSYCKKDYRKLRHELIEYVTENFAEMTTDELEQAATHFCAPQAVIDQFYTQAEQIQLGKEFHRNATECRRDRFDGVVSVLFNHLEYEEAGEIIQDLGDYIWKYVELGVEGTTERDPVGLFDYFVSESGTIFENSGFMEKDFIPRHGTSLQELSDLVMDVLRNGCGPACEAFLLATSGS